MFVFSAKRLLWLLALLLSLVTCWRLVGRFHQNSLNAQLIEAVTGGDLDQVRLLLRRGADAGTHNPYGYTLLRVADDHTRSSISKSSDTEIVRILVAADRNVVFKSRDGEELLCLAARYGNVAQVKRLLDGGTEMNSAASYGTSPLIEASRNGQMAVVHLLLDRGAELNAGGNGFDQEGPLVAACRAGNLDIAQSLLARGAVIPKKILSYAETPAMAQMLIANGANVNEEGLENGHILPPTEQSMKSSRFMVSALEDQADHKRWNVVAVLLAHGAKMDGEHGAATLISACAAGNLRAVQMLLAHGANPRQPNWHGDTPLAIAQHMKRSDIVAVLKRGGK